MTTVINGSYPAVNSDSDATINGLTVGKGGGAVASNSAVGYQALNSNTTGTNGLAVGYQALYSNTTASRHTAVGYQAGYSVTTNDAVTAVGYLAGNANTGGFSVFVGRNAGYVSTASKGTMIGDGAGSEITSGANNTILGRYTGNQGGLDIRTASNNIVLSDGDGNPRGIFDNNGYYYVGCTANPSASVFGVRLGTNGTNFWLSSASVTSSYQHMQFGNTNGFVGSISTSGSTTTYATSSDYRLKENVSPMTGALAKVQALKPVTYTWKADGSSSQGFIAHELQAVVPECVTGEKDALNKEGKPEYQGIDTSFLVATLTAAIQELKAEVDSLKAQLGK